MHAFAADVMYAMHINLNRHVVVIFVDVVVAAVPLSLSSLWLLLLLLLVSLRCDVLSNLSTRLHGSNTLLLLFCFGFVLSSFPLPELRKRPT